MDIGARIKMRREELNMSQDELAKRVGYKSRSSINKIESDGRGLPQKKIVSFANALDTTPAYLMGWEADSFHRLSLDAFYSSEDGHKLISSYLSLNELGKQNLLDHCDLLLSSEKYRVEKSPSVGQLYLFEGKYTEPYKENKNLNAAHERTDIDVTDEMRKHDDDIMDGEDF